MCVYVWVCMYIHGRNLLCATHFHALLSAISVGDKAPEPLIGNKKTNIRT